MQWAYDGWIVKKIEGELLALAVKSSRATGSAVRRDTGPCLPMLRSYRSHRGCWPVGWSLRRRQGDHYQSDHTRRRRPVVEWES